MSDSRGVVADGGKAAVENDGPEINFLTAIYDNYGGVVVEMKEHFDPEAFLEILRASVRKWREEGIKGVWIKLPTGSINLAETAIKEGFWIHHAEPTHLMLAYWIPQGAHTLPGNASHRVRVCAFVMNDKREVLVVQEKNGILRGKNIWKFPTGVVTQGEDIKMAAVREVKEETGIDTEFVEVLAFRECHKTKFFGKSELVFFCMLHPVSFVLRRQESEIALLRWMPFKEYTEQQFVQEDELTSYLVDICLAKTHGHYSGFTPVSAAATFYQAGDLYSYHQDLQK